MWIVLSFVSCFLSAVAAVYRKSGIKGQNPFWYGAISLTISTITIFIIGIITGDNGNLLFMPQYIFNLTIISGIIQRQILFNLVQLLAFNLGRGLSVYYFPNPFGKFWHPLVNILDEFKKLRYVFFCELHCSNIFMSKPLSTNSLIR